MTRFATHELERALQNGTRVAEGLFPLGVIDHHYVKYLPHLAHRTQPAKDYSFIHSQTQHAIRRRRKLTSTVSKQKQKQKCPLPDIHATRPHTERNLTATTRKRNNDDNAAEDEMIDYGRRSRKRSSVVGRRCSSAIVSRMDY